MILEFYLLDYLKAELETDNVYLVVPEKKPQVFFLVDKLGSTTENRIATAHVAIQSWNASAAEACKANERVKEVMLELLPTEKEICSVSLNSDYPYHDTATKHPRYQAVFDIVHY